jgi:hypothetical protein
LTWSTSVRQAYAGAIDSQAIAAVSLPGTELRHGASRLRAKCSTLFVRIAVVRVDLSPPALYLRAGATDMGGGQMTTFDKREEGFEKKFALDEELKFKATARRNRYLGHWAAQKLGLAGADADAYAKEVVLADFEEAGDDDVFRKLRKDFDAKGVTESDHQIRRTMDEMMAKAVAEIKASG